MSSSSHVPTLPASRAGGMARHFFCTSRVVVNHGKNAVNPDMAGMQTDGAAGS
jgi:hypothetical protein